MSDPLPSRTRPRGSEALGVQPGEVVGIVEPESQPVSPGATFLLLGLVTLGIAAWVIATSRD